MPESPVQVAVVTGGHSFDVPHFHRLFRGMARVDAYVQHLDDFTSSPERVRDDYDAVVFYIMPRDTPTDEAAPWYAGKPRAALQHLGKAAQGLVIWHHALVAYPDWPLWSKIIGIDDRSMDYAAGQSLRIVPSDSDHPIIRGLASWEMTDETYRMADPDIDSEVLLSVDHPQSMRHIAWTRRHDRSRVFCFQSGHDNATWSHPMFREVLERGIVWSAGRT